jgi:MFS family permease
MVTAYFVAYGFAGLFLFSLPDKWGRWKTMAVFGTIHVLAQFTILLVPIYQVRMAAFALMGACQLKNSTSYCWLFDLVESKHKSSVCGFINSFDMLTLSVIAFYFMFLTHYWFYLFMGMTVLGALSLVFLLTCVPESPKWLFI